MKNNKKLVAGIIMVILMTAIMSIAVFADDPSTATTIEEGIKNGAKEVYGLIKAITLPIAVVVMAISGLKVLIGGEKGLEVAKKSFIVAVVALAIILLAGVIINNISQWFEGVNDPIFGAVMSKFLV